MNSTIKNIFHQNYYSAQAYYWARDRYKGILAHGFNLDDKEKLVVYSMQKVGSTTMMMSLQSLKLNLPVYHIHHLTSQRKDEYEKYYQENYQQLKILPDSLRHSQYLSNRMDKDLNNKKWKIISLTRDPIATNISLFFHLLNYQCPDLQYDYISKANFMNYEDIIEELKMIFLNKFSFHDVPLTWFNDELKTVLNVDVFSSDFPKNKGYQIYHSEQVSVLLMKMEKMNECAPVALNNLLDINNFALVRANTATNKDYGDIYRKFIKHIHLPESYIDKMYDSSYMRRFYTPEEIDNFKAKWMKKLPK